LDAGVDNQVVTVHSIAAAKNHGILLGFERISAFLDPGNIFGHSVGFFPDSFLKIEYPTSDESPGGWVIMLIGRLYNGNIQRRTLVE
jgi:hypothetical protein